MKYTVRNADGQLTYESFDQLKEAAASGLVEANDEVLREGETEWRKASTMPKLLSKMETKKPFNPMLIWIGIAVVGAIGAFVAIKNGNVKDKPELYAFGLVLAFAVVGILFKVTADSAKRR
ncbi:MAG: GYF domain-containing protein [Archangium sp.]